MQTSDLRPSAPELLIRTEHTVVSFAGRRALDDVSLDIRAGEHLALTGGNGAGKSTLLRLLAGLQRPDPTCGGRIVWYEAGVPDASPLTGRSMAALVSPAQQERISGRGWNITGAELVIGGLTDAVFLREQELAAHRRAAEQTAAALGASALLERPIPTLSQGQLRLLLIARALIRRPVVLLLDEVTDGLDTKARTRVNDALLAVAARSTLILSTHRPETLPGIVRRAVRLQHGRLVAGDAVPCGAATPPTATRPAVPSDAPLSGVEITLSNVTVYVDRTPVLHNIDWRIESGRNWAVLGGNGAGKSTLLRLLAGDENAALGGCVYRTLPRQGGELRTLDDIRRSIRLVSDRLQACYGYDLTGLELVCSGQDNTVGAYRAFTPAEQEEARAALARLHASHLAEKPMRACSTGELRRLFLARALTGNPALLLLDEPCSGLDPETRADFLQTIDAQVALGLQCVLVTHHAAELIPAITHVLILEQGRVRFAGRREKAPEVVSFSEKFV